MKNFFTAIVLNVLVIYCFALNSFAENKSYENAKKNSETCTGNYYNYFTDLNNYDSGIPKDNMCYIKLAGAENVAGSLNDTIMIYFDPNATVGFDASYDITKIMNTDPHIPNFFSVISGSVYAQLNGLPPLDTAIFTVPLGYSVGSNVQQIISAAEINNFPAGTAIYLEDVQQGVLQDLTVNPDYVFSILTTDPSTGRFFLKFDLPNVAGVDDNLESEPYFNSYFNGNNLYVSCDGKKYNSCTIEIFDMYGRIVESYHKIYNGAHNFNFDFNSGVYFIKYTYGGISRVNKLFKN